MTKELIKTYTEQRDRLRKQFEAERTGEQLQFIDQSKLFKPITEAQNKSSQAIQDKIATSQDTISNALIPFTAELKKRNDQLEELHALPFYGAPREIEDVPQSTPKKEKIIYDVNLDGELLNETHRENLSILQLKLPSIVQGEGDFESVFKTIESRNRKLGQNLREDNKKTKKEGKKEMYKSQQETLKIYTEKIKGLKGASQFILKKGEGLHKQRKLCKQKRGKGRPKKYPDTILYNSPNNLCEKLNELVIAKRAGNTGLDNSINAVLDELLNIGAVDKDYYNVLYKNIFA